MMGCSFLPRSEMADRFDSVVEELMRSGSACYVVESGKPRAVILDVDKYHAMMDIIEASTAASRDDVDAELLRSALKTEPDA